MKIFSNALLQFSLLVVLFFSCQQKKEKATTAFDPWDQLDSLIQNIQTTDFPDTTFLITDHGASSDRDFDNSEAFRRAIEICSSIGGGKVVVPADTFYINGPIYLESNVNLHLEKGAVIRFSTKPSDYLPVVFTRWEGTELMTYSPLIYAFEEENIALTGKGTLDGQADETNWWPWKGREEYGWKEGMPSQLDSASNPRLLRMGDNDVPVVERIFAEGTYLRPQFFQPYKCKKVLVKDVTFIRSPMWIMHPVLSEHVIIDGVTVESHGPNNDGCDPEASKNVWIKNCYFNTGDDCIAIKSGRNRDGRRVGVASENIIVQDCKMKNGHGGVVIGSEASGGVKNVFAEKCIMDSPLLDRALRIKTSSQRGGVIENIYMRDVEVGQVKEAAFKFNMFYGNPGEHLPVIRNIQVKNVNVENGGEYGIWAKGYEESPIKNIEFINCTIKNAEEDMFLENVEVFNFDNVKINGKEVNQVNNK